MASTLSTSSPAAADIDGCSSSFTSCMPDDYVSATSAEERKAHEKLYESFKEGGSRGVVLSSKPWKGGVRLMCVFEDCIGSLGVICAALASQRIMITRVSAFTTRTDSIGVDTFQLSSLGASAETVLRECLERKIFESRGTHDGMDASLPETYAHVTTPTEREAHRRMFSAWRQNPKGVQIEWSQGLEYASGSDVSLHLVFRDVEGSLAIITAALASCGINVKRVAAFTTRQGPTAIDTFQLDAFDADAEAFLAEQLNAHLREIEG